jgi:hypothetical protein
MSATRSLQSQLPKTRINRCVYRKLNPNVLMMKSTQDSERT